MPLNDNIYQRAEAILKAHLLAKGKRCTHERLMVLQYICSLDRHFTADNLVKDLCEQQHISNATIYNTLGLLCQANILRILPRKQQQGAQYEICLGEKNSLRFICTECGREVEFKNKSIEHLLVDNRFSNFVMENFTLAVYGHCKICRRKRK